MKRCIHITVGILLTLVIVHSGYANYAFYKKVKDTCAAYRVAVDDQNMELTPEVFSLVLNSNRNNFEMVMLVGFASAGQAIQHQKYLAERLQDYQPVIPSEINVLVNIPIGRGSTVVSASASAELVEQLSNGTIDADEFMSRIKESIQTL
jgi:hypothetical protein